MRFLKVQLILIVSLLVLSHSFIDLAFAEEDEPLYGPIAHIEVEHKKIDHTYYFMLNGFHSFMHVGRIVEYEWQITTNDTDEQYLSGPFQTLEISDIGIYNISLRIVTEDTREDTKKMSIKIKDDGYGYLRMSMTITNDIRLTENLEQDRTIILERDADQTWLYVLIGILSTLLIASIIIIIFLNNNRKKFGD